jgi:tellurite resistance protein TerC
MSSEVIFFAGFAVFVIFVMMLDLGAFNRQSTSHIVSFREAASWSAVWVVLALGFYAFLRYFGYWVHDISDPSHLQTVQDLYYPNLTLPADFDAALAVFQSNMALEYLTGYLVEYSLSVDNIFVFILIFNSFGVREIYYKKVLVWGILGSIVLRFVFIFVGSALIQEFSWVLYIFGAFLVYTGISILISKDKEEGIDVQKHPAVRLTSRYFNVFERYVVDHFFIRSKRTRKFYVTPLFVVMIVIAFTDVVFAVDSIPAIFSITKDPYIVFFSNVFAIMGLRSMFFFLVNIIDMFSYLKYGLGVLLTFIGLKMLFEHQLHEWGFNNLYSLLVIVGILAISIAASLLFPPKENAPAVGVKE